jgi:modulator of FtsH protease HflC
MTNNYDGDLEKFLKKVKGSLGGTPPNGNDNPETIIPVSKKQPMNKKKMITLTSIIVGVFAIFVIALTNVYVVKENEYKIVRQFGEIVRFDNEPGIKMKVPFIQSVTTIPKSLQTYSMTEEEINTLDKKRIIIDNYAIWRVTDPKKLIGNAGTVENAQSRMEEFIYSVLRTELGQLPYDAIINDENSSRGSVNEGVTEKVNELLAKDNYGIEVIDVRIRRIDLPSDNEQSIFTRMVSERESQSQVYLSEGDALKRRSEADVDQQVKEMLAQAHREAAEIIADGEAEAARIYNESFAKDPEFYSLYRTLESYKKTIGEDTMIILPADSPYARLLQGYTN